ncbi:hypothetical protein, partial [Amycolatopsis magusensis]|uniref:hypothetical protein n=1 Tax=Amycolatopsis magusensis TaxID=882444 RepID=UPI0024A7E45E
VRGLTLSPRTAAGARRRTEALLLVFVVAITVLGQASVGLAMNGTLPADLTGFTISMSLQHWWGTWACGGSRRTRIR